MCVLASFGVCAHMKAEMDIRCSFLVALQLCLLIQSLTEPELHWLGRLPLSLRVLFFGIAAPVLGL